MDQSLADFPDQKPVDTSDFPDQPKVDTGVSHGPFIDSIYNYGKNLVQHPIDTLNEPLLPEAHLYNSVETGRDILGPDGVARPNPNYSKYSLTGVTEDLIKPFMNEVVRPLTSPLGVVSGLMGLRAAHTEVEPTSEPAIKNKMYGTQLDLPLQEVPKEGLVPNQLKPRLRVTSEGLKPVAPGESWADKFPDQPGTSTTEARQELAQPEKYQFTGNEWKVAKQLSEPVADQPVAETKPKYKLVGDKFVKQEVDQPDNTPISEASPDVKLPKVLAGAKPRYRTSTLEFESDLDKAAYITAQENKSKGDASYLKFVMDNTGLTEAEVRARGRDIKRSIKNLEPDEKDNIVVPKSSGRESFIRGESGSFNPKEITDRIKKALEDASPVYKLAMPDVETQGAVGKLFAAIEDARSLQAPQEELRSAERSKRAGAFAGAGGTGQEWFKKASSQLAGEYPKVLAEPLKLGQRDVNKLFNTIKDSDLRPFEQKRTGDALVKILSGSELPQPNELRLLDATFGKGFGSAIMELHGGLGAIKPNLSIIKEGIGLSRALKTGMDMSWPLRQGITIFHRGEYWNAFKDMVVGHGSQEYYNDVMDNIHSRLLFRINENTGKSYAERVGLKLAGVAGEGYGQHEENFMTKLAGKIPLLSHSERAYTGMANQVRADVFESMIKDLQQEGRNPLQNLHLGQQVAEYVNNATGRGSLGKLEKYAPALNQGLFAPRFIASRIKFLNPQTYIMQQDPMIRQQYLKSLGSVTGTGLATLGLAKLAGAQVELDPRSSDFMKAKISDNTRLDPWAGFQQYFTALANTIQEVKKHVNGEKEPFGYTHAIPKFAYYKLSPAASTGLRAILGKDPITGQRMTISDEMWRNFEPMFINDVREILQTDPKSLPVIPLDFFGMSTQTYQPKMGGNIQMLRPPK
jgi:hypothetical protein